MKKKISFILALVMLVSALASCAVSPRSAIRSNIRVTSSDALDAAAWLDARLGERLTDRVVLGTDAEAYGVDVDTLEADGYVIRTIGSEVALLANTADGLDRAARRYAKMLEAGAVTDVTYHEGSRIKRVELAGRDIGEYTVYCENDEYMTAAEEFCARIAEACGAKLAVSTETPAAPYIRIAYAHDDALGTCGYRWTVGGDGLTIECSDGYKPSSAYYAFTRFLVTELDWFGLDNGFEDLPAAELVSIPVGKSGGEVNDFDNPDLFYGDTIIDWDRFENRSSSSHPMSSLHVCCHGLQSNRFAGELSKSPDKNWAWDQPCYLDDNFLEISIEDVRKYIEDHGKVQAMGEGHPLFVDIAAPDNSAWCGCKECTRMYRVEGETQSAAVLTWANALSDALSAEYPNVKYGVFAYAGSNKPPKTVRPNDKLHITYCYDGCCSAHSLDGHDCENAQLHISGQVYTNKEMTAQLRRWCEISENVYVWFYGLGNRLLSMSFTRTIREDMRFFHDIGVRGMFWNNDDFGYTSGKAAMWLGASMIWDVYMSDEELDAIYDRILRVMYGDASAAVKAYFTEIDDIQRSGACATCWWWGEAVSPQLFAVAELWKDKYDGLYDLLERAIPLADSAIQERRLEMTACGCIYTGSMASYFAAYNAGDDARVAELSRRYAQINERMTKYGMDMTVYLPGLGVKGYDTDLEVHAWNSYLHDTGSMIPLYPDKPTREMPERVAAILAGRG